MNRRMRTAFIGGVVIAAVVLMGAGFPTKGEPPKQWANDVCTSVNDWVDTTQAGAADLDTTLNSNNIGLRDVRNALVGYMGDVADATTVAIDGLEAAGVPATPKGKKAAATLTASFKDIRTSLRKLQNQAEDISIRREGKALKQVKALNRQVDEEFGSFQDALGHLKKLDPNHKLKKAFAADAACQAL